MQHDHLPYSCTGQEYFDGCNKTQLNNHIMETSVQTFQETVKSEGDIIFVKPLCDFFKINYDNQAERIKNDQILSNCTGKKPFKTLFGDNYPRVYLDKKGFVRWIQIINPSILQDGLRERFIQYQSDIFDYLYGTVQEENEIKKLLEEKLNIDAQLKDLASKKRHTIKMLDSALYGRYQYQLDFVAEEGPEN